VETRYPGDWLEPTDEDASQALLQAGAVHEAVAAEFRLRGVLTT